MGADVETIRIEGSLLADLYARHADEALRLSYLLTGDGALAEALVQDAFVRVAGRLLHLRDPGGFHAYLRKTVVNLAKSHYRRRAPGVERDQPAQLAAFSPEFEAWLSVDRLCLSTGARSITRYRSVGPNGW